MALEINEIGIRMQVRDAVSEPDRPEEQQRSGSAKLNHEQIVGECVRLVLQALKAIGER